jgi:hypothetical protein
MPVPRPSEGPMPLRDPGLTAAQMPPTEVSNTETDRSLQTDERLFSGCFLAWPQAPKSRNLSLSIPHGN